jgi:hypothetical protein
MPRPLGLSDSQLETVMVIARGLHVADRGPFLETLAAKVNGNPEIGDGLLHRMAKETARQFFRAPVVEPPE